MYDQESGSYSYIKELIEEYLIKLKSSKEQDPEKNLLFIEIREKFSVAINGLSAVSPYEKLLPLTFIKFWKEHLFDKLYEDYIEEFTKRMALSSDKEKLLEIEAQSLSIDVSDTSITGNIEIDGKKLGYLISINGDNPVLANLIGKVTKYDFGVEEHLMDHADDYLDEEFWQLKLESFSKIFRKLHWVAVGYLTAQKRQYIKSISIVTPISAVSEEAENANGRTMSHKQQILLLQKLGVFDLPKIRELTMQNQGKLFAKLLNKNEKNTEDYIRYRNGKNTDKKYSLDGPAVQKEVNELLKDLGLENF